MLSALASVMTGRRVRPDTSMTGEITLSGLVFPVGGIKEKVLAAHRAGIRRVMLPSRNEADLEDVPEDVQRELEIVFATSAGDVLKEALERLVANPPLPLTGGISNVRPEALMPDPMADGSAGDAREPVHVRER